jgi:DNA-binding transcriptional LysR family regulator
LFNEQNYLYCAQGNPLFDCDDKDINKLMQAAEIATSNYHRDKEEMPHGLTAHHTATAYHDQGIAHLVLSGKFIGYLPEHYAQLWVEKGMLKAIQPEKYAYEIEVMLITAKNSVLTPLTKEVIAELKAAHD